MCHRTKPHMKGVVDHPKMMVKFVMKRGRAKSSVHFCSVDANLEQILQIRVRNRT
jgi:hypothetical protein